MLRISGTSASATGAIGAFGDDQGSPREEQSDQCRDRDYGVFDTPFAWKAQVHGYEGSIEDHNSIFAAACEWVFRSKGSPASLDPDMRVRKRAGERGVRYGETISTYVSSTTIVNGSSGPICCHFGSTAYGVF